MERGLGQGEPLGGKSGGGDGLGGSLHQPDGDHRDGGGSRGIKTYFILDSPSTIWLKCIY